VMTTIELVILTVVLFAAFVHAARAGAANPFSWGWFGFGYTPASFAARSILRSGSARSAPFSRRG